MEILPLNMDDIKPRETRTDSLISELAKDGSNEFALLDESSAQGTQMMESVPSDWTDEKHHLFLESMEASFVSQMFDSTHSVGSCSSKENPSRTKLHGQSQPASHIPTHFGQFKVLRRGSWKNINFEPTNSQLNVLSEYQSLSRNPWIHHFRAARRHKNVACKSQAICSRGKVSLPFESTNSSRPVHASESHMSQQYISNNRGIEVSDQNFVDEDSEAEKGSSVCDVKRVKTPETSALSNDQVVPSNKIHEGDGV